MSDAESFLLSISEQLLPIDRERLLSLSLSEQTFALVWDLEAEVNNGGFNQFFFNSAGDHAPATAAALRRIGAEHTAAIVDRAIARFPGGPSGDRAVRQTELEAVDPDSERFADLDQAFFSYRDDLSALLYDFVLRHRSEFRGA